MMRLALGLSIAALLAGAPAHAQTHDPAQSCESWNAAMPASAVRASFLSFVLDAIATHDAEPDRDYYGGQIDLTDGIDANELASMLDGYCSANPRGTPREAADALVRDLGARWVASHAGRDRR